MAIATAWIRRYPAFLGLIAAVLVGQVVERVIQPHLERAFPGGPLPIVALTALAISLVLAVVIVWLRVSLGHQGVAAARARTLSLPAPDALPAQYAIKDPPGRLVSGLLAMLDLALLLLVQSTLRLPAVVIASMYVTRSMADTAFVGLVVLLALIVLVKLYRAGGPVVALLLWWGLDRVVPTAGFLGAKPIPARVAIAAVLQPQLAEATEKSAEAQPRAEFEATLKSVKPEPASDFGTTVTSDKPEPAADLGATVTSAKPDHAAPEPDSRLKSATTPEHAADLQATVTSAKPDHVAPEPDSRLKSATTPEHAADLQATVTSAKPDHAVPVPDSTPKAATTPEPVSDLDSTVAAAQPDLEAPAKSTPPPKSDLEATTLSPESP